VLTVTGKLRQSSSRVQSNLIKSPNSFKTRSRTLASNGQLSDSLYPEILGFYTFKNGYQRTLDPRGSNMGVTKWSEAIGGAKLHAAIPADSGGAQHEDPGETTRLIRPIPQQDLWTLIHETFHRGERELDVRGTEAPSYCYYYYTQSIEDRSALEWTSS
jgi:hypothetical protein